MSLIPPRLDKPEPKERHLPELVFFPLLRDQFLAELAYPDVKVFSVIDARIKGDVKVSVTFLLPLGRFEASEEAFSNYQDAFLFAAAVVHRYFYAIEYQKAKARSM